MATIDETYKKEQERLDRKEKEEAGTLPPEKMTTKEILADKEQSALFIKMVQQNGGDMDMMSRLAEGKLEDSDLADLEDFRADFEGRMVRVENIKKELTPEMITEIGRNFPDFQELLNNVKPEDMESVVESQLADLAIEDPGRFSIISNQVERIQGFKRVEGKELDDSVKEMCKDMKIDESKYIKTLAIKDDAEREKALADLARSRWGNTIWADIARFADKKLGNAFSGRTVQELAAHKGQIDAYLSDLDHLKANVGWALNQTIRGNDEMIKGLSKAILGESTKVERFGFKESKNICLKDSEVESRWGKQKKDVIKNWDTLTAADKDIERKKFVDALKAEAKAKNKGGMWAPIFEAFFDTFLTGKMPNLN